MRAVEPGSDIGKKATFVMEQLKIGKWKSLVCLEAFSFCAHVLIETPITLKPPNP